MENNVSSSKQIKTKWTWYLFLVANVFLVLGVAITWILFHESFEFSIIILPISILGILGIITMIVFYWFESKELILIRQHVNKKWFNYYLLAGIAYIFNLIITFALVFIDINVIPDFFRMQMFIIIFVVVALISLISIGLYRYGRFRIDLDLYRRKRGEELKKIKAKELEKLQHRNMKSSKYKNIKKQDGKNNDNEQIASSGLTNKIEKKDKK